jgi:hypothetical protein
VLEHWAGVTHVQLRFATHFTTRIIILLSLGELLAIIVLAMRGAVV